MLGFHYGITWYNVRSKLGLENWNTLYDVTPCGNIEKEL